MKETRNTVYNLAIIGLKQRLMTSCYGNALCITGLYEGALRQFLTYKTTFIYHLTSLCLIRWIHFNVIPYGNIPWSNSVLWINTNHEHIWRAYSHNISAITGSKHRHWLHMYGLRYEAHKKRWRKIHHYSPDNFRDHDISAALFILLAICAGATKIVRNPPKTSSWDYQH